MNFPVVNTHSKLGLVWLTGVGLLLHNANGRCQSLSDLEMHLASSRSFILSSMKNLYFKGMVYGFVAMGGPIVGRSISTKFIQLKSAEDLETIHVNSLFNIVLSLFCINGGTFAFCSYISDLLLSCACVWKLDWSGNTGSRGCTCFCGVSLCALSMMNCIALGEMFLMHSTLFTLVMNPKMVFLNNFISMSAVFNIGTISSCGCLFLMLCSTSKGMRPLGSCLSKLISNKLLISKFCGVLMENHMIDLLCN